MPKTWYNHTMEYYLAISFPHSSVGKKSTCNAGDPSLIPGLERSPGEWKSYPLQYSGPENSIDCIVHGVSKSQTQLTDFHFHFSCNRGISPAQNCLKSKGPLLSLITENNRMISVPFQGKPFSIMVIQVYAPTNNTEEAEVEWFYEDLQDLLELTPQKMSFSL